MQSKLERETETVTRLRKQTTEITVARQAAEQMANELQMERAKLQAQRDNLQQDVATLQVSISLSLSENNHQPLGGVITARIIKHLWYIFAMCVLCVMFCRGNYRKSVVLDRKRRL